MRYKMARHTNTKTLIRNSVFLYFRMIFIMLVSMYTSRVILETLGIDDYGLYNVVGGAVVMFGFLNMSMTTATSRFINYELGKNKCSVHNLRKVFSSCLAVHFVDAVLVLLLCETIGLYLLYNVMSIPSNRFFACMIVFQTSLISLFISILFTPFHASIIAHERMSAFAYMGIIEAMLKLFVVYLLKIIPEDRLITYTLLYFFISLIMSFVYVLYCWHNFEETKKLVKFDSSLFKSIFYFGGWNLLGDGAYALFSNGINILLNIFFGPSVNAARGIMVQVNGIAIKFTQSFQTAINPQIIKSYSGNDIGYTKNLVLLSSRFTLYVLLIIIIPLYCYIDVLLMLWLKSVPLYTSVFVRLMLLISIFDALGNPITNAVNATGKNKRYQLIISGTMLLICPIAYVCLSLGCQPYSVFMVHLFIGMAAHFLRIKYLTRLMGLSLKDYAKQIILPGCTILLLSFLFFELISSVTFYIGLFCLVLFVLLLIFIVGINNKEKMFVSQRIRAVFVR